MNHIEQTQEKYAVIDIGTNSARLLIYRYDEDRQVIRIKKAVRYTRMGQDVNRTGRLHPDAMKRNMDALAEYKKICTDHDVKNIFVFGTSAMRDAVNTSGFIQRVKRELGLEVQVISGQAEADLGFKGVSQCFDGDILVFDIGGGSTELIYGGDQGIYNMQSIDVGCVRSTEKYIHHDPPAVAESAGIKTEAACGVKTVLDSFENLSYQTLVGIGGTATTLATIKNAMIEYDSEKVHRSIVTKEDIENILIRLQAVPLVERKNIIGLDEQRADIIIAGCCILSAIMAETGQNQYVVCDFDNLEGAAQTFFDQIVKK